MRSVSSSASAASAAASGQAERRVSWGCSKLGSISYLERQEESVPALGDDECLVAVRAIGLNYADVFCVLGLYEAANKMLKEQGGGVLVPGLEFAGLVLRTGKDVTGFRAGDRVIGFTRFGSYRTAVTVRARLLRKMPETWSFAQGAALLVQGLTAWHGMVELGNAKKGSRVLVHSAAGGVGCAALQICESLGCEAVAIVGAESKVAFLRERFPSCKPLLRAAERQYSKQLDEIGVEYDVVLESLGGKYFSAALAHVAPMGRLVHFGATHAYGGSPVDGLRKWLKLVPSYLKRPRVDPSLLVGTNRAVMGFNLIWLTEKEDELDAEVTAMLSDGGLDRRPPAVGKAFPFAQLPEALAFLRSGASVGKVVVTVEEDDGSPT